MARPSKRLPLKSFHISKSNRMRAGVIPASAMSRGLRFSIREDPESLRQKKTPLAMCLPAALPFRDNAKPYDVTSHQFLLMSLKIKLVRPFSCKSQRS